MLYAIQCKRCNILYIGETGRSLSERFREHLRDTKNEDRLPVPLHFNSPDHRGVEDISIFGLRRCQGGEYSRFIALLAVQFYNLTEGYILSSSNSDYFFYWILPVFSCIPFS